MATLLSLGPGLWVLLALAAVLLALWVLFRPWNLGGLEARPVPAPTYAQAEERIAGLGAAVGAAQNPECALQFLTHGRQADWAIVLAHGYTNCPRQYRLLGQRFFERGYNVLAPLLPHHGLADRLTDAHAALTAEALRDYADDCLNLAHGLGRRVAMLGLSGGGTATAWAAQFRPDLDLAVIISPAFGFLPLPAAVTVPAVNLIPRLPNTFAWWDPEQQASAGPAHTYPRYAYHALANILRLGLAVRRAARLQPPRAARVLVVTNANDASVDNAATARVVAAWQRLAPGRVSAFEFPAALGLGHDLIDPTQPDQQVELVYAKLFELIDLSAQPPG